MMPAWPKNLTGGECRSQAERVYSGAAEIMGGLLIRFRHLTWAMRALSGLVLLGTLLIFSTCSPAEAPPLRFEVLVDESLGLRENALVRTNNGEVLGRVTTLRKNEAGTILALELDSKYRGRLSREASFQVSALETGDELHLGEAFGTPSIEDGTRIDARPGWLDRLSRGIGEWEGRTRELIGGAGSALGGFLKSLGQSPEAQGLKDSIEELGRDIATVTRDRAQRFVETELPQLEEKARRHRDKLISEGRDTEAQIFWKWFERWAHTMRGETKSLPAESEADSQSAGKPPA